MLLLILLVYHVALVEVRVHTYLSDVTIQLVGNPKHSCHVMSHTVFQYASDLHMYNPPALPSCAPGQPMI